MALSPCTELSLEERLELLALARHSIARELGGSSGGLQVGESPALALKRGVFVTLTRAGALRGCIGTLEGDRPLAISIPDCARGAAFRDPRFPAVEEPELAELRVEISVLTEPQNLQVDSREALLDVLRPGVDGLVLEQGHHRATFLPQVWEQLTQPEEFLGRLLNKAGLPGNYWSQRLSCSRYQCIKFTEQ